MKKLLTGILALSLLISGGCKKSSPSSAIGTWTFKGINYYATDAEGTANVLTASDASANNLTLFNGLSFNFPGSTLPTASGRYTVVGPRGGTSGNWVTIAASLDGGGTGNIWTSTGKDGSYANVSISAAGKVTVQVSSVMVLNATTGDSSAVANITVNQQ